MDHRKLHVGSLPHDVTNEDLRSIFGQFGELKSVKISTDVVTNVSKGYGFVDFVSPDDAARARDALHDRPWSGPTKSPGATAIQVVVSTHGARAHATPESEVLYIANLPDGVTSQRLKEVVETAVPVVDVSYPRHQARGDVAFVRCRSAAEARLAIQALNESTPFSERPLHAIQVRFRDSVSSHGGAQQRSAAGGEASSPRGNAAPAHPHDVGRHRGSGPRSSLTQGGMPAHNQPQFNYHSANVGGTGQSPSPSFPPQPHPHLIGAPYQAGGMLSTPVIASPVAFAPTAVSPYYTLIAQGSGVAGGMEMSPGAAGGPYPAAMFAPPPQFMMMSNAAVGAATPPAFVHPSAFSRVGPPASAGGTPQAVMLSHPPPPMMLAFGPMPPPSPLPAAPFVAGPGHASFADPRQASFPRPGDICLENVASPHGDFGSIQAMLAGFGGGISNLAVSPPAFGSGNLCHAETCFVRLRDPGAHGAAVNFINDSQQHHVRSIGNRRAVPLVASLLN